MSFILVKLRYDLGQKPLIKLYYMNLCLVGSESERRDPVQFLTRKMYILVLCIGTTAIWTIQSHAFDTVPNLETKEPASESTVLESPLVGMELTLMPNLQLYQDGTGLDLLVGVRREIGMLYCDLNDWRKNIVIGGGLISGFANSPMHGVRNYGFYLEAGYQFDLKELFPSFAFLDSFLGPRLSVVADLGTTYNTVDERGLRVFNGANFYAAPRAAIDFQLPMYRPIRVGLGIASVINANAFWTISSMTLGLFGSYRF